MIKYQLETNDKHHVIKLRQNTTMHDASMLESKLSLPENKWPIFISYRRGAISKQIALDLKKELEACIIEARTGQQFSLDVFVDVAEAHQSDFQANLVPHLQHSRALIVLADGHAAKRKVGDERDYLYEELNWWAAERRKTPPIILQLENGTGSVLVSNPNFSNWRRVSFMDCFWQKWTLDGLTGETEKQQLLKWIRESIRDYGLIVHLDEVRRLRRRAIFAAIFAVFACVAAGVAYLQKTDADNQRDIAKKQEGLAKEQEAEANRQRDYAQKQEREAKLQRDEADRQKTEATVQRDRAIQQEEIAKTQTARALERTYVNTVNLASLNVAAGAFQKARQLLFTCPSDLRKWEWWYLLGRCGPKTRSIEELSSLVDKKWADELSAVTKQLDALPSDNSSGPIRLPYYTKNRGTSSQLIIEYDQYAGRGGSVLHTWRTLGDKRVLLNGYYTGMYGGIPAAQFLSPLCIVWKGEAGESRSGPAMASGQMLMATEANISALRERYVISDTGNLETAEDPNIDYGHAVDVRTWPDRKIRVDEKLQLYFESKNLLSVTEQNRQDSDSEPSENSAPKWSIDLTDSTLSLAQASKATLHTKLLQAAQTTLKPDETAFNLAIVEYNSLNELEKENYKFSVEKGREGPIILTTWGYGNVRIRDAKTGKLIGESLRTARPSDDEDFLSPSSYGGINAVIPGTNLIAGWLWWKDTIQNGIFDLAKGEKLLAFEYGDIEVSFAYTVNTSISVAPNGVELVYQLYGRNEHLFGVWNLASGKLVYGNIAEHINAETTSAKRTPPVDGSDESDLPTAYAWAPSGKFVVICRPGGETEMRENFGQTPFAKLEGVVPDEKFRVQELNDQSRVLIGNAVVDTRQWHTVLTLPQPFALTDDSLNVAIQTRKGVVDVIRLGFQPGMSNRDPALPLSIPEKMLLIELKEPAH